MTPHSTTSADDTSEGRTCFDCDSLVDKTWGTHRFTYGLGAAAVELTANLPIHVCPSCGLEFLDDEAETLKHEAICAHLGLLSPKEIRAIRGMHGMSRAEFSEVTGLGKATLNRWENGILIQSAANDRYLRLLATPGNIRLLDGRAWDSGASVSSSQTRAPRFRTIDESQHRHQQAQFSLRRVA